MRAKVTLSQPLHVQDKIATCAPSLISTSLSTGHQNGYFPYLGGNVLFVCPWSGLHEIYKSVLVHVALTLGGPASPREAGPIFWRRAPVGGHGMQASYFPISPARFLHWGQIGQQRRAWGLSTFRGYLRPPATR